MPKKTFRHVRHHAKKHEEAHKRLKNLLGKELYYEKVGGIFLTTFLLTAATILIFLNWNRIIGFLEVQSPQKTPQAPISEQPQDFKGFQTALFSNLLINGQTANEFMKYLKQIPASGYEKGMKTAVILSRKKKLPEGEEDVFLSSIYLSTTLSQGGYLTGLNDIRGMQKSILSTFYLGEKTVEIDSTLQTDAELLGKINNALSVDIFAYLNQSVDRANALDNYLNLLKILQLKALDRSQDLASVMQFLSGNFTAQEQAVKISEQMFFNNLQIFSGPDAEEELGRFIGLQKGQTEIRAKMGAYQGLRDYYAFFLPKLDLLIRAAQANRDPLIAGVKVVEVQNMTLPLIIRQN